MSHKEKTMPAPVINLDSYRNLFKDDAALNEFASRLSEAASDDDMRLLIFRDEIVAAVVSSESARDQLRSRILRKIAGEGPQVLDKLMKRLESEDIVD
jgi:hypothetical protein